MHSETSPTKTFVPNAAEAFRAEQVLTELAGSSWSAGLINLPLPQLFRPKKNKSEEDFPDVASRYRILVEQIPAIVFMAFIEKGLSEAYVSPQIERMLGFTQEEWLQDPVRWYQQIHPDDKARWSIEAAKTFMTGETLRSVYRVLSRNGRVISFQCEVRMVRREDGSPWFIHGVGFDITELKQVEEALFKTQNDLRHYIRELEHEIAERRRAEDALRESVKAQRELSRRLLEVQEAERRRIALELHDEIGQKLTGLKLTLENGARSSEKNNEFIAQAQNLVNELMSETRQLSLALRPATLDHLGLLSALLQLIRSYQAQTQIEVNFKHHGIAGRRFAPELETAAYRVVQESLTNIARHAKATSANLSVWADALSLKLIIEDNGKGFDLQKFGFGQNSGGLSGMKERVRLLDGHFQLESAKNKGTKIIADWYLEDFLATKE